MPSQMEASIQQSQPLTQSYGPFGTAASLGTRFVNNTSMGSKPDTTKTDNEAGTTATGASKSTAISIPKKDEDDQDAQNATSASGSGVVGSSVSLLTKSLRFIDSSPSQGVELFQSHFNPATQIAGGFSFDSGRRQSIASIQQQLQQQQDQEDEAHVQAQAEAQAMFMPPQEELVPSSAPAYAQQPELESYDQDPSHLPASVDGDEQWHGIVRNPLGSGFPRRVRKTSFDHTVAREGIEEFRGRAGGRHQVNGRPMAPPDEVVDTVRISLFS